MLNLIDFISFIEIPSLSLKIYLFNGNFDFLTDAVLSIGIYIACAFGLGFDDALLTYCSNLGVARFIAECSVLLDLLAGLFACKFEALALL